MLLAKDVRLEPQDLANFLSMIRSLVRDFILVARHSSSLPTCLRPFDEIVCSVIFVLIARVVKYFDLLR